MKKLLFLFLFLMSFGMVQAQPGNPTINFRNADPSGTCSAQPMQYNYTLGKLWGCKAGTWTLIADSSGSSLTPCGPTVGEVQLYASSSALGCGTNLIGYTVALSTPSAPGAITQGGTPATTAYGYKVALCDQVGCTPFSTETTTTTGAATLNGTNYNIIPAPTCGSASYFAVSRSSSMGTPGSTGFLVTNGTCGVAYHDTGIATFIDSNTFGSFENTTDGTTGIYGNSVKADNFRLGAMAQSTYGLFGFFSPVNIQDIAQVDGEFLETHFLNVPQSDATVYNELGTAFFYANYEGSGGFSGGVFGGLNALIAEVNTTSNGATVDYMSGFQAFSQANTGTIITNSIAGKFQALCGVGATCVNQTAIEIGSNQTTGTVTTNIGLKIDNQSGGATSYSIMAGTGKVEFDDLKTTGAATGKNIVCVDPATGILYASSSGVACAN